jgi:hypothetical protein
MTRAGCLRIAARVVFCLAIAAAAASAQDPDAPPPGTLVLGPVRITPGLVIRDMGVDNNVKNESVDPKSDFTFAVAPSANVAFRMRRLRASYDLTTEYVYFHTYEEEGGVNTSSLARIEFDLGRLRPYATAQGVDTKTRLNREVDARARHHDTTYGAGASMRVAARTQVLFNASTGKVAYDPGEEFRGVDLSTSFDGRREMMEAGLGFELTPITTLKMMTTREQQRFELSPDRNSNTWRLAPTLQFTPDGLLTGSATVGYRRFDMISPLLPDYSGVFAAVTVGASIYSRHQLQANVSHDVHYSYDQTTLYYLSTATGFTWTTVVAGPIDVRATASRSVMDYRGEGTTDAGEDLFVTYGGGVGYRFTPRARLGVDVDWSHRESSRSAEREYRNHRLFAGLTWGVKP